MNARSARNWRALVALVSGLGLAFNAMAQTTAAASNNNEGEAVRLDKFVVTGSLIPIAADSPAIPVTIITAGDIERSGISTDLLQVLKKTEPYFYGANNIGSDNGNIASGSTNGGSAVALRNRATLVLLNGRRVNVNPVTASGGGTFVDVSMIPLAAVERIEVLSDGASATYGSDAVSGVVNVILKTNYSGGEVGGRYGWSPNKGKYREKSYYGVFGASNDKTSVTISTEWKKSDPLIQFERPFGVGQFRTPSYAGVVNIGNSWYYLNPSLNAPPLNTDMTPAQLVAAGIYQGPLDQTGASQFFDLASYPTMLIKAERRSFAGAVSHQLTDAITLFGDFLYTVNRTQSVLNAQPVAGNVAGDHPFNPFNVTVTARNRFVTFPRIYNNESVTTRGVVGMKGSLGGAWTYELAGAFNRTNSKFRNDNLIDAAAYTAAVTNQTYNPFARTQAPGVVQGMLGSSFRDYVSELNSFDLRVAGEVFDLPAGPLQVGFGAETRWESLDFTNDRYDRTGGWLQATPRQPFRARSTTDGFFGEVRVPVFDRGNSIPGFHSLEVSAAVRKDIYSKTSDPFVPKYTVKWLPFNDELALRATYSESFSAPTLFSLLGPISQGFTPSINIQRYDTSGNILTGQFTGSRQYRSRSGSNANLRPSESRNWTAGVVWSPKKFKGLEVSADWFSIDERDLVSSISSALIVRSLEQFGPASPYASMVKLGVSQTGETYFDTGTAVTSPGQMSNRPSDSVWITNQLVNIAGVWQSGLDGRVSYTYDTDTWGKLRGSVTATYINEYVIQSLPTSAPFDYAGTFSGSSVYPRIRTYTSLTWSYKNITAGLAHTYIPSVEDVAWSTRYDIEKYHNFDLQVGYTFSGWANKWLDGLNLSVGVNNVFNKYPPLARSEGNQSHDINTYDPIGRFIYFTGKYKF